MTTDTAALLLPAIRWDATRGFDAERPAIERALSLGVGGFILFGGPAEAVRELTRELHERSRHPLLVGADLERGAGQQFEGLTGLPPLAALAWLGDAGVVRRAAALTAREARRLGINWDYAPVCDLDVDPENPIVGTRALGGDPDTVGALAAEWIDACQGQGVLACAKHFPGHGRTRGDSHVELPTVHTSGDVLRAQDMAPFRAAIDAGVASIMSAHVAYPALDASGLPATLSPAILGGILRSEMGFDGLVVTDALIMEGVRGEGEHEAVVRALDAGCDLLLYPEDLASVARAVDDAVRSGRLGAERLHRSLERRRHWAEWAAGAADEARSSEELEADDWGVEIASRVIHVVRGDARSLDRVTEVVVVDDDLGGPYPPPSRDPFLRALAGDGSREVRVVDAPTAASRGPLVVALFGDIRAWKGRPGYSAAAREAVAAACRAAQDAARDAIVVQFSHPRLAAELTGAANVICAWGGERVMQEAAGRWMGSARG